MSDGLRHSLEQLEQALARLEEALAEPESNPLLVDGAIQRFEFTIELFWKSMKHLLDREGVDARTPREVLRGAFQAGWITDEVLWLDLLRDRNETSHAYNAVLARQIFGDVKEAVPELRRVLGLLRSKAAEGAT